MLALPLMQNGDDATADRERRQVSSTLLELVAYSVNTLFLSHYVGTVVNLTISALKLSGVD